MIKRNLPSIDSLSRLLRNIALLTGIGVLAYKVVITPIQLSLDLPTILSLLLALFSIYLSSMFYFKATETSNSFYDNTFKFTKDIAEILVRIESGFGEHLHHLDESYTRMQGQFERYSHPEELERTQEEANQSKTELEEKVKERDKLIQELANRAKLHGNERASMLDRLATVEEELNDARQQLSLYQDELGRARALQNDAHASRPQDSKKDPGQKVINYLRIRILPQLDPSFIARAPAILVNRRWRDNNNVFPNGFIHDLQELGYVDSDNDLTPLGLKIVKSEARRLIEMPGNIPE
jgi:hypothetical protein